jgi:hypothetical protein
MFVSFIIIGPPYQSFDKMYMFVSKKRAKKWATRKPPIMRVAGGTPPVTLPIPVVN